MNKEETLCYTNVYLLFSFFGVASLAKEEAFIGTRLADSGPCGHCWVRVYLDSKFLATAQTLKCIFSKDVDVQLIHVLTHRRLHEKCAFFVFKHTHTHTHKADTQLSSEEC